MLYKSLIALFVLPAFACNSKMRSLPSCLQQRISAIQKEAKWNPPAEINEYVYHGKKVYLFSANCCDQFNTLVDENCNTLCAPSGGITGKGDRKCTDFADSATHVPVVWKDDRQ